MANDTRAPFVSFFVRAVEDRQASLANGFFTKKDVDYVRIVPSGSEGKTVLEYVYADWLVNVKKHTGAHIAAGSSSDTPVMAASRFPTEWVSRIEEGYKAWKEGRELPVEGTPLANWPVIGPSAVDNCLAIHIRTVEELADANEDVIGSLGMGGVVLRQRARDWLAAKHGDAGKHSAELEALRTQLSQQKDQIDFLTRQLRDQTKEAA